MSKGDIAKKYFEQGYNCSQSVALAFADEVGMDGKLIARLTGGFGGGMGRMREVCLRFMAIQTQPMPMQRHSYMPMFKRWQVSLRIKTARSFAVICWD